MYRHEQHRGPHTLSTLGWMKLGLLILTALIFYSLMASPSASNAPMDQAEVETLHHVVQNYVQEKQLGSSFGGFFLNWETQEPTALFTDWVQGHRQSLEKRSTAARHLRIRGVNFSEQHLRSQVAQITDGLKAGQFLSVRFVTTELQNNRVRVDIGKGLPTTASDEALIERTYDAADVYQLESATFTKNVATIPSKDCVDQNDVTSCVKPNRNNHAPPWYAGSGGNACTQGFALNGLDSFRGYMLSAGHCYPTVGMEVVNAGGYRIGRAVATENNSNRDAAVIELDQESQTGPYTWASYPATRRVVNTDLGHEAVGYTRCMSGASSLHWCGPLLDTNATTVSTTDEGAGVPHENMRVVRAGSAANPRPGDSGAPWWHPLNGEAYASGVHTGRYQRHDTVEGLTYTYSFGVYTYIGNAFVASTSLRTN